MSDLERIEAAMEEKVRPALRSHGGDISIDHVEEIGRASCRERV